MACRGRASDDLFGVGLALMCCVAIVLEGYETYYCSLWPTATTFLCRCRTFSSSGGVQAPEAGLLCAHRKSFRPIERYRSRTCICSAQCIEFLVEKWRQGTSFVEVHHNNCKRGPEAESCSLAGGSLSAHWVWAGHTAAPRCTRNRVNLRLAVN
jgi:hypothetical protein